MMPRIAFDEEARQLGEAFENACAVAVVVYERGEDPTDADAEVDRLLEVLRSKGLA